MVTLPALVSVYWTLQEPAGPMSHVAAGGRKDPVDEDVVKVTVPGGKGGAGGVAVELGTAAVQV